MCVCVHVHVHVCVCACERESERERDQTHKINRKNRHTLLHQYSYYLTVGVGGAECFYSSRILSPSMGHDGFKNVTLQYFMSVHAMVKSQ